MDKKVLCSLLSLIIIISLSGNAYALPSKIVEPKPIKIIKEPLVPIEIYIYINSTPQGAQIWMDGQNTSKVTPDKIYFDTTGNHTFELRLDGYQPYQENIYVSGSMTKEVTLTPLRSVSIVRKIDQRQITQGVNLQTVKILLPPNVTYETRAAIMRFIMIKINSIPQGAQIWLDGEKKNEMTPATIPIPDVGNHTYELYLNQYQPYNGSFEISFTQGAISINGVGVSTAAASDGALSTASSASRAEAAVITQTLIPLQSEVTETPLQEEKQKELQTDSQKELQKGTSIPTPQALIYIYTNSTPQGAQIWMDEEYTKKLTPDIIYFDKPGSHTLKLILSGYQTYQESINISDSMPKEVTLIPLQTSTTTLTPTKSTPGFLLLALLIAIFFAHSVLRNRR